MFILLSPLLLHSSLLTLSAMACNDEIAVVGTEDGNLHVWNLITNEPICVHGHSSVPVSSLVASAQGTTLLAGDTDGTVSVWR